MKNYLLQSSAVTAVLLGMLSSSVALAYSGASPGSVSVQLLASGKIDLVNDTVTVPLHHGHLKDGRELWYVVIDSSDAQDAKAKGLVFAPALSQAANDPGTRTLTRDQNGQFYFDRGTVDFSAIRSVTPGNAPNLFPPKAATPGSVGDSGYSPYVKYQVGGKVIVYNAPIVAFNVSATAISFCDSKAPVDHSIVNDKVVRICPRTGEVTLGLSHGFAEGKPLIYVSLDSNDPVAAALEGATYAPALNSLKGSGATLPLFAVTNGQTGKANPERQGFDSALSGDGSPLNVLTGIPTLSSAPYSPLWDLHVAAWTDAAITAGKSVALKSAEQFGSTYAAGLISGLGGADLPSSGLLVNCPAIAILK